MQKYSVIHGCQAKDVLMSSFTGGESMAYFAQGDTVYGQPYHGAPNTILIEGRYLVPQSNLGETSNGLQIKEESEYQPKDGEIDRLKSTVSDVVTGKSVDKKKAFGRSYRTGAAIGTVGGVLAAMYFQKKIFWFAVGGFVIGGYIAKTVTDIKYNTTKNYKK